MAGTSFGLSYVNPMGWRSFSIASGSMMPGLMIGDRVMAGIQQSMPERGDVAVFLVPRPPLADYVKRVIGLPGDRVQLRHSIVYLNGQPLSREPSKPLSLPSAPPTTTFKAYRETLQGGRSYAIVEMFADGPGDNTEEYVVPAGHFFTLSDNRDNGLDSRHFGYVPLRNLIGVVRSMYWSHDPSKLLSRVE
jgi:signal peptidase I